MDRKLNHQNVKKLLGIFKDFLKENTPEITPILFLELNRQSVKILRAKVKNDQKYSFDKNHIYWKTTLYRNKGNGAKFNIFEHFSRKILQRSHQFYF
jgi:hypothetical protein